MGVKQKETQKKYEGICKDSLAWPEIWAFSPRSLSCSISWITLTGTKSPCWTHSLHVKGTYEPGLGLGLFKLCTDHINYVPCPMSAIHIDMCRQTVKCGVCVEWEGQRKREREGEQRHCGHIAAWHVWISSVWGSVWVFGRDSQRDSHVFMNT